ncbi:MAG: hypothetical protein JXR51_09230 [Bacteroidales bacterium]|nr:hypothetical protein [Bacteroidales bacterium]MBN2757346.1 hypothetical protein [Bacteroidales bacterium]
MRKGVFSHSRRDQILINIKTADYADKFFKKFDSSLEKGYIFDKNRQGNKLEFKGSIFRFAWNGWNLFNNISNGIIEFQEENEKVFIHHKIYFLEIFTIALIFTIIPVTMFGGWKLKTIVFFAIWIIYLIGYFVSVFRFNSLISETLINVNKTSGYELENEHNNI